MGGRGLRKGEKSISYGAKLDLSPSIEMQSGITANPFPFHGVLAIQAFDRRVIE